MSYLAQETLAKDVFLPAAFSDKLYTLKISQWKSFP